MGEIRIVKATVDDVPGILEVLYQTWLDTYPNAEHGITAEDIHDRFRHRKTVVGQAHLAHIVESPEFGLTLLVAKDGDTVIGECRAVRCFRYNELRTLYVLPSYQRQGVGYRLWCEAKKHFNLHKDTSTPLT